MKRNDSQIKSKRRQKYELDRVSWTMYVNFHAMYIHNYTKMIKASVAKLLNNPE